MQSSSLRQKFKNLKQSIGFTLIELMIVIAIIGLLAMFAVPTYQNYIIRTLVTDALSLAESAKTAVTEYYINFGEFPADNSVAGLPEPSALQNNSVAALSISESSGTGNITLSFRDEGVPEEIRSQTLILSAVVNAGQINWICTDGSLDPKYRPTVCRKEF